MRQQPEQQAPPVQRLRIRYAKRGRLRFTSHRDFSRAFERAAFRARIPMAYSSGFNPHPRISYAGAAPTGAASEAEYLEIGLAEIVEATTVKAALDEAMPDGLDLLEVVESTGGSLPDLLQASSWVIDLPTPLPEAEAAVAAFLAAPEVMVERMMKKGLRTFDARAAVVALAAAPRESGGVGTGREQSRLRPTGVRRSRHGPGAEPAAAGGASCGACRTSRRRRLGPGEGRRAPGGAGARWSGPAHPARPGPVRRDDGRERPPRPLRRRDRLGGLASPSGLGSGLVGHAVLLGPSGRRAGRSAAATGSEEPRAGSASLSVAAALPAGRQRDPEPSPDRGRAGTC